MDMYYDSSYYGEMDLDFFFIWYLLYYGVVLLISLAAYILQSLSLYTIAKRRCIKKPWLAWLPVGYSWILGSIADQYRYVKMGQVKNKRKALLVLEIVAAILGIVCSVLIGKFLVQVIEYARYANTMFTVDPTLEIEVVGTFFAMTGVALLLSGIKIASTVVSYVALYDLYRSCEPKNAVLYLVLSIIIGITRPVFMIVCCKKDGGMPPRKPQPAPVAVPQPQPVQEPWEKPEEE